MSIQVPEGRSYAPEYDFEVYDGPPKLTYVLATIPRSGSTFLSHELWKTGALGAPLEYLNFEGGMLDRSSLENLNGHLASIWRARTSPNGVFGLKLFPNDIKQALQTSRNILPVLRGAKYIYLTRRNKIRQAVSYARAKQTGAWVATALEQTSPTYSEAEIDQAMEQIFVQERFWTAYFDRLEINPLMIEYEDVAKDVRLGIAEIADFVGVEISGGADLPTPSVAVQSDSISSEWVDRYQASLSTREASAN